MALTIRKAVATDAADLANIYSRSWEKAYADIVPDDAIKMKNADRLTRFQQILANEHSNYIAHFDGTAVGAMMLPPCRDDDLPDNLKPHAGEVGAIYLLPDYWDKGYGREMMNFAMDTLKSKGFSIVTLWVLEENSRARRFYERCGFTFDGTKKEITIGKALIEIRYRKDIAAVRPVDIRVCADEAAKLIRRSFATVADEFSLTPQNCPTNPAFTTAEALIKRLEKDDCISYGLYICGVMIGFITLMAADNGAYEITRLAVAPEKRHNGYGKMLLNAAVSKTRELGADMVVIGIINDNTVLKQWYKDYGFMETATKEYPSLPFTVCEMERSLKE